MTVTNGKSPRQPRIMNQPQGHHEIPASPLIAIPASRASTVEREKIALSRRLSPQTDLPREIAISDLPGFHDGLEAGP